MFILIGSVFSYRDNESEGRFDRVKRMRIGVWGVVAAALLALMVVVLFGDVLFVRGNAVGAYVRSDINMYFSGSRWFGFGEIGRGNVPLWNPHVFSGSTFVGNFQSALFYPPNLMYVVLPLAKAFNADLAFHVLLFGLLTFAWARGRGQRPAAAALAGSVAMFGSAFYLHVYAGHLTMLGGFAWAPLLFLAIDKTFEKPRAAWVIVGILSVTMQILSGLPQVLLVTGVSAVLYVWLRLLELVWRRRGAGGPSFWVVLCALAVMGIGPFFVGAIQLWPGLEAAAASTRGGGVPLEFATSYSFPRVNLAMLLAPHVFGGQLGAPYWGRWLYWEVSLYVGVIALVLAFYGVLRGRSYWYLGVAAVVLLAIALGRYAPLSAYKWLHGGLPGFDSFRGPARFLTPVSLLLAVLAGAGADRLLGLPKGRRWFAILPLLLGLTLGVFSALLRHAVADPAWQDTLVRAASHIRYEPARALQMSAEAARTYWFATSGQLAVSAALLSVLGLLWGISGRFRPMAYVIVALAMCEVFVFGWGHRGEFELAQDTLPRLQQFEAIHGEGARILHLSPTHPQLGTAQLYDVWGYDPVVNRRYAELFARSAGISRPLVGAGIMTSFLARARPGPLMRLLRLEATVKKNGSVEQIPGRFAPLPRFLLVHQYQLTRTFKETMDAIQQPGFDPVAVVVLQAKPEPEPELDPLGNAGRVEVVESGSDYAVLDVEVESPAILLNTDAYADGWRAVPVVKGPQERYRVMRADYALRAIPLAAGRHRIRLEYAPLSFRAGRASSVVSAGLMAGAGLLVLLRGRRMRRGRMKDEG